MFAVEVVAGLAAGSASLQADALDFLGDAGNYAISPFVVGMTLRYRALAAFLKGATWGLIPHGCKDPEGGRKPINARAESVARLPTFRAAYAKRRCIVPVDCFFEWRASKGARAKQPFVPIADVHFPPSNAHNQSTY
jgi:putative SOS response-associated peptidase YedK